MVFFLVMLVLATAFFGVCFFLLGSASFLYTYSRHTSDALAEGAILVLGTFLAGALTASCIFASLVIGAHLF